MNKISLDELSWCDANSEVLNIEAVLNRVNNRKDLVEIHVGCDSHFVGNICKFAIVVAMYERGKGGTYFFARAKRARSLFTNMKIRLLKEVELAIMLAELLSSLDTTDRNKISVHLDINPNKKFKSNVVFTSATSWVKSLGYQCVVKPDSWASSWLADAYAK